jgi:hypothetical protein
MISWVVFVVITAVDGASGRANFTSLDFHGRPFPPLGRRKSRLFAADVAFSVNRFDD